MGKQHKRGADKHHDEHRRSRHKRPCISAPSAMANFGLTFHRVERNREKRWNAKAKWDAVTTDVAGRTLPVNTDGNARADGYQIQLQACDASGDPVDLPLTEEDPKEQQAKVWTDVSGTSTIVKTHERRLEVSGNVINSPNLTGLTAGIEESVEFFARCESGSPNVKCEVWNQTDGTSVVSKTQSVTEAHHGKLVAKMKWTPVAGKTYRFRVTWSSGSGKPILSKTEMWDASDDMTWIKQAQDEDTKVLFKELVRPKVYYYRARGRARINHHHRRCWSAWTSWTTAINPVTGDEAGMDPPDGLGIKFDRTGGKRHNPFTAILTWNEAGWWIPPVGDAQEGAKAYQVKMAVSTDGGSTTNHTRKKTLLARDADADTTAEARFARIRRDNHYRAAVRSKDHEGNWGAWSAWTSWESPKTASGGNVGAGPGNPLNVTKEKPRKGVILWEWDEPSTPEDVDHYRIKIYGGAGGTLKKTRKTRSTHYRYTVPTADAGTAHHAEVAAIDHEGNSSSDNDPGSITDDGLDAAEAIGSVKKHAWTTIPSDWLKCDGASYSTSAPYDQLFAVIGYTYGGSGANYNVPDFRKRHPRGIGTGEAVAENEGVAEGSRDNTFQTHAHTTHGSHVGHGSHGSHNSDSIQDSADHAHTVGTSANYTHNQVSGRQGTSAGLVLTSPTTHDHNVPSTGGRSATHSHGHSTNHNQGGADGHGSHNDHGSHSEHGTNEHDIDASNGHKVRPHLKMHFIIKYQ